MGAALAVWAANSGRMKAGLDGVVAIDVVEGTAIGKEVWKMMYVEVLTLGRVLDREAKYAVPPPPLLHAFGFPVSHPYPLRPLPLPPFPSQLRSPTWPASWPLDPGTSTVSGRPSHGVGARACAVARRPRRCRCHRS